MDKRSLIADLRIKRDDAKLTADKIINKVRQEERVLTDAESASLDRYLSEAEAFKERIDELEAHIRADDAAAPMAQRYAPSTNSLRNSNMTGSARITSEPSTYTREGRNSYFLDLARVAQTGDRDARQRLERNDAEQRALNTTNGAGGEFVPPLWIEQEYVKYARPHRVFADLVTNNPLPAGTDSINIPKVSGGTATAVQGTQNSAVQQTDMVTTAIASSVFTVAGGQTISLQMLEQSPIRTDEVILSDLAADYAKQLDTLYLTGSGSAGQPTGILTLGGVNTVTVATGASLTGANSIYTAVASAISKIWTTRYAAPTAIVMHPRRFAWMLAQVDSSNRPIILPATSGGAFNAAGLIAPDLSAEGPAGYFAGLPVYLDPNIPTNLGAGTNEDRIIVLKADDVFSWEGNFKAEAFPHTYANQLSMFLRVYNYASFQPARYPSSISVISGAGLSQVLA
ncbi:phage major capsid protein [Streptomyces sp. NPDC090499]|uniref:phage major capsid protein n=1 Tax=Streptomyces sp. NPDC090499 TaxID=3365965 RepID=UPI0038032DBD